MQVEARVFDEVAVSGFSHKDPEIAFYTQVAALLRPEDTVLDFGAGRGEFYYEDQSTYRQRLQNLRGRCAHVDGCDVDAAVMQNPTLDHGTVVKPGTRLPYEDGRFDIVISRYVFEHIDAPDWLANELLRVTKPGGWICALTANRWGYVALGARLIPNKLHARVLQCIQPHRKVEDVFPTTYKLNRPGEVRRYFGHGADVFYYSTSGVPSYHFGSQRVLRALTVLHRFIPSVLDVGLAFFIRKHAVPA